MQLLTEDLSIEEAGPGNPFLNEDTNTPQIQPTVIEPSASGPVAITPQGKTIQIQPGANPAKSTPTSTYQRKTLSISSLGSSASGLGQIGVKTNNGSPL